MSCAHKDIFGKPRQGVHKYRIPVLDIALVDTLLTVLVAAIVAKVLKVSFVLTFIVFILGGIVIHKIFCVDTRFNSVIFDTRGV
jgi:hypothetical protein